MELKESGIAEQTKQKPYSEMSKAEMENYYREYLQTVDREETLQQNNGKLENLIEDVLAYGDLLLVANKGVGKTNSLMVLAQRFRQVPDTRVIVFEDFPKFALEFDCMPYFVVHDSDVVESVHAIDMGGYFLKHEQDYTVKRGAEIQEFLDSNKDLIFTSEISDIERMAFFIYSVVDYFYRRAYLRKFKGYSKMERIVFVIEESQNVFDSSIISKKIFNRLRKIFSVARNLDLHFVLATQRLQDLNTKIRGRTRLLLGRVSLDDYELKVNRLLRHSKFRADILEFERGEFLNCADDKTIKFPRFKAIGKPYEWNMSRNEQPKSERSMWQSVKNALGRNTRKVNRSMVITVQTAYSAADLDSYSWLGV
jgi:hypothetical protein